MDPLTLSELDLSEVSASLKARFCFLPRVMPILGVTSHETHGVMLSLCTQSFELETEGIQKNKSNLEFHA